MPWVKELSDPQALKRCIRDLVALSTLPAIWRGYNPRQIAGSLAAELLSMISADVIYIVVPEVSAQLPLEVIRTVNVLSFESLGHIEHLLREVAAGRGDKIGIIDDNPLGAGSLRITAVPIGFGGDALIVAGSANRYFPTETQRLILGIAANNATIALHCWHSEVMKAEAVDFLEKPYSDDALKDGARPKKTDEVSAAVDLISSLSLRERQVLDALVAGQTNKTIGLKLGISVRTVEVHRARMMDRLGVRQLGEAVRLAVLAKLFEEG